MTESEFGLNLPGLAPNEGIALRGQEHHFVQFYDEDTVDAWPDEKLFGEIIGGAIAGAAANHPMRVRAYGDLVALLCVQAKHEAAIRLEELWNSLVPEVPLSLLCGYPTHAFSGLGVGLTMVKRIVEQHGGSVAATSAGPGAGTELTIKLPTLHSASAGDNAEPHTAGKPALQPIRVLIIEDNLDAAESLMMLLELLGYEVSVAHDGISGMSRAREKSPDIMLVDIGLPGIDGYEVARQVRQEPTLQKTRLIAVTGYGSREDRRQAFTAGFDDHMVKPVDPEVLERLIALHAPQR